MEAMIFALAVLSTVLWVGDLIERHIDQNLNKIYALNAIMKRQQRRK